MGFYYNYNRRHGASALPRPLGVGIIATAGMLFGLALLVLVLVNSWLAVRDGTPLLEAAMSLALGMFAMLCMIWISWALWDQLEWAWRVHVVGGGALTLLSLFALFFLPQVAAALDRLLPDAATPLLQPAVITLALICAIALLITATLYLVRVRSTFGIGVEKPLWERRGT